MNRVKQFRTILVVLALLPLDVFAVDEDQTAETVLIYQRSSGGWPKNYDRDEQLTESRRK